MKIIIYMMMIFMLSACNLAPTYQRPTTINALKYKESGHWLRAKPASATVDRGPWWMMYHDPVLNQLEMRVILCNQDLKAALARYEQARAAVCIAKSEYYPRMNGIGNATRQHASNTTANPVTDSLYNDVIFGVNLNYEVDVWGRVRNTVAAAKDTAKASAADYAAVNLSLQAELAIDYFTLRGTDASIRILDQTIKAYQKSLYLIRQRYKGGATPIGDVYAAETQLDTAKTQAADLRLQRAQLEHAIAVLIGQPPATVSIKPTHTEPQLVTVIPHLPSTLLERRPDIAEAEYLVEAANANIGVARAAYFPSFNLASVIGFESQAIATLLHRPSLVWSLGPVTVTGLLNTNSVPELQQVIFDGGRIRGMNNLAWAEYNEKVAKYRQTVLNAYQEVEDSLAGLRQLSKESITQGAATKAAYKSLDQALYRYQGGLTTYIDVVVVENIALQNNLSFINIKTREQIASVQLIKALGGGWRECLRS